MNYYRIKRELERRNISIRSISKNIGVTEQGLHQMIRNGSMKISVLEEISKFLKLDVMYWFRDEHKLVQANEDNADYQNLAEDPDVKMLRLKLAQIMNAIIQESVQENK